MEKLSLESQINLFLDNRLSRDQEIDLISSMKSSPECCKTLSQEQNFRFFVKNNCPRKKCSDEFIAKIRNCVKDKNAPI